MAFTYKSGQEIKLGDQIKLNGWPGKVEFVVTQPTGDPAKDWYFEEFGGGVMINDQHFGNVFLGKENIEGDEGFEFVSRAPETST